MEFLRSERFRLDRPYPRQLKFPPARREKLKALDMDNETETSRPKRKSFFTQWTNFVNREKKIKSNPHRYDKVRERLRRLPYLQELEELDDLRDTLSLMNQGRSVLRSALKEPLGYPRERGETLTVAQKARVSQWRLVMGFGGMETVCKAVILPRRSTWRDPRYGEFLSEMVSTFQLNQRRNPAEFPAPSSRPPNAVREDFFRAAHLSEDGKVRRVLNLNNHDLRLLREYAQDGSPLDTWQDRLQLAKTLRNCTVHGALSATRTHHLGLVPVCNALVDDMVTFLQAIFEHLVADESP